MLRIALYVAAGILLLVIVAVIALVFLSRSQRRPDDLGPREGRLAACPSSPNCVSSQAEFEAQRIAPLAGSLEAIAAALAEEPGTTIVVRDAGYLHAECRSRLFGFIDDLELLVDEEQGVVQVRSAARVGRSDMGVNRARIERVRAALEP